MKNTITLFIISSLFAQQIFAQNGSAMGAANQSCGLIARECVASGYTNTNYDKSFWDDCMRPLLLGKAVIGVEVNSSDVRACKVSKIQELKEQIDELEKAPN